MDMTSKRGEELSEWTEQILYQRKPIKPGNGNQETSRADQASATGIPKEEKAQQ